jgi:hypothetical protein
MRYHLRYFPRAAKVWISVQYYSMVISVMKNNSYQQVVKVNFKLI